MDLFTITIFLNLGIILAGIVEFLFTKSSENAK